MNVVSVICAVVVFALAAMWAVVGVLGLTQRLPGSRWFGVRSSTTVKSEEAFRVANQVAGPGMVGAAVVLLMGGVLTLGVPGSWSWLFAVATLLCALFIVSIVSGMGVRAAEALPAPPSGCSASGCGCGGGEHDTAADGACAAGVDTAASPAADCDQPSCGACSLQGLCTSPHGL